MFFMDELSEAKTRLADAVAAIDSARRDRDFGVLRAAYADQATAQRDVARLSGHQFAEPIDLGVRMSAGAPEPQVISGSGNTIVVFYLSGQDMAAKGVVHFKGAYLTKFGGLNDEAMEGHPLHGHGLEPYVAHVVRNSEWISEAEQANSVHPNHKPGWSERYQHYIICFHDETFECIAATWQADTVTATMADAMRLAVDRLASP
jgi:hypothetical protein